MDLKIFRLALGSYQTNCYIIFNKNNKAVIIDPGAQAEDIIKAVENNKLIVDKIILTHAHPDHFGALEEVRDKFNVKAYLSAKDIDMLSKRSLELKSILGMDSKPIIADYILEDGDKIPFDDKEFKVIATPGHTPGGICLYIDNFLFSGDTLFNGSIGRTDLPGGDYDSIMLSLKNLMKLPDDTIVLPGHGPETSIGYEKLNNPFIRNIK
ncbi:MAG: MBL fold metallo-hydrolase [Peptoniphilaceae bacterium]